MKTSRNCKALENHVQQPQPAHRKGVSVLAALVFLSGVCSSAWAQRDSFDDGNDTANPTWTRYNPILTGTWSFPGGNSYRIQTAASPDPVNFGQGRAGSLVDVNYTNFYTSVDLVAWDDTIHQVVGLLARISTPGPGTTRGYMFTHDRGNPLNSGGDMDIVRLDNEVPTVLNNTSGSDSIYFEPGKQYRIVFFAVGTNFTGQVFELPNTVNPVLQITASDVTYAAGTSGLVVANNASPTYDGPGDATFDNFVADQAPLLTDDFNDGNDSAPAPGWVRYNPIMTGSWDFPGGNRYRIQSAASPDRLNFGPGRAGALRPGNLTNFYLSVDIVDWDDTVHQVVGLLARVRDAGPGTTTGYMFTHDRGNPSSSTSGDMDIVFLSNEIGVALPNTSGSDAIHFEPGKQYRLVFIGEGPNLTGQVYELPNLDQPVVNITTVDYSFDSGASGLIGANNPDSASNGPADVTFDNFVEISGGEPRLSFSYNQGNLELSWPLVPFALQGSGSLNSAVWTTITEGITIVGERNTYTVPTGGSAQYFRLKYP